MIKKRNIMTMASILTLFSLLSGGCGSTQPAARSETDGNAGTDFQSISEITTESRDDTISYPASFQITADNYFDYQPGLECSAFASAYLLRHFGEDADGLTLFEDFPGKLPGGNGVSPSGIEQFWEEREGYSAEFKTGGTVEDLKRLVSADVPVIVFIHVEEPYDTPHNTHYIPLVGYDEEYFYFAESLDYMANCKDDTGLNYNRKTEISKFERLWENIDAAWDFPYFIISKDHT